MPIQDIWGFTLLAVGSEHSQIASATLTIYTPSDVVVQGAISIADNFRAWDFGTAYIQQVDIPGYGELELGPDTTTVRWELNSITFAVALGQYKEPTITSAILVAAYSG